MGIPQGCPFSMMVLYLIRRPCILEMRFKGLIPRILVDDILLIAHSNPETPLATHHQRNFVDGYDRTLQFFTDMGANI